MVKRIGEYSRIIGWFLGIIDTKLQLFLALKFRNYFDTSLTHCKHKNGEIDRYTLIEQSHTLIEQSPTLIKQTPILIKWWFILIEQSFTLIEQSFISIEQPPNLKTANPESTFLKLDSHA